jgi:glucan phosphoethanolaminetransferase (alkaline phosphatase superfamily)
VIDSCSRLHRAALPLFVFLTIIAVHYVWMGYFPERDPVQDRWVSVATTEVSWYRHYVESQSYWLGYSYALPLAFAAVTIRRYRRQRRRAGRILAIGSVTLTGFLATAGCFLLGCCGSPMFAVYLSLFGASFLPFAKPIVAALTTAMIVAAWAWMNRQTRRVACDAESCAPKSLR